jgi:membrane protein implicated in regulation of membrane protease activity
MSTMFVAVAMATLVVAIFLTGSYALFVFVPFYSSALLVAGAQVLDSRHQKRTRGQLPSRAAQ